MSMLPMLVGFPDLPPGIIAHLYYLGKRGYLGFETS